MLVLAAGAQPNFFHTPGAAEYAYPLYSLDDAERLRAAAARSCSTTPTAKPELIDEGALTSSSSAAGRPGSRPPAPWPSWSTT